MPTTLSLYRRARRLGLDVTLADLFGMFARKVSPRVVLEAVVITGEAGVRYSLEDAEVHYLASAHPVEIARAAAILTARGEQPDITALMACDLVAYDVVRLVQDRKDYKTAVGGPNPPGPMYRRA
jgi:uncharacterized protein YqfA (UPF0365 family)